MTKFLNLSCVAQNTPSQDVDDLIDIILAQHFCHLGHSGYSLKVAFIWLQRLLGGGSRGNAGVVYSMCLCVSVCVIVPVYVRM